MNIKKLKQAEEKFLMHFPGGFENPLMLEIKKKHKPEKMTASARESFALEQFENPDAVVKAMGKIVAQSSMVSLFEKPKFRDLLKVVTDDQTAYLAAGLKEFLHGNQEYGFNIMAELLDQYRLAKWTLLTICPFYYRPDTEVFIKPTTVKNAIEFFELKGLVYRPRPTYEFYTAYREQINEMKKHVQPVLQVDNGAFGGFLMMSMEDDVRNS